jgi:hypothetical protein
VAQLANLGVAECLLGGACHLLQSNSGSLMTVEYDQQSLEKECPPSIVDNVQQSVHTLQRGPYIGCIPQGCRVELQLGISSSIEAQMRAAFCPSRDKAESVQVGRVEASAIMSITSGINIRSISEASGVFMITEGECFPCTRSIS